MTDHIDHTYHLNPLGRSAMQTTDHDEDLERETGRAPDAEDETTKEHDSSGDVETTDHEQPDDEQPDGEDGDDEPDEADETTTGAPDSASAGTPTADQPEDVRPLPAAPDAVTGIIRGLATTIPPKGTMMLAIGRTEDDSVLVTIVPARAQKETASAIPLVVRGTAEEIDRELVAALQHYVPARHLALRTAEEIARDTAAAAKQAQVSAKARTTPKARTAPAPAPVKKKPTLTVHLEPDDAVLRVVDGANRPQSVKPGVAAELAKGTYIITATKPGFRTKMRTVVLKDEPQDVTIALESDQMSLLGGNAA